MKNVIITIALLFLGTFSFGQIADTTNVVLKLTVQEEVYTYQLLGKRPSEESENVRAYWKGQVANQQGQERDIKIPAGALRYVGAVVAKQPWEEVNGIMIKILTLLNPPSTEEPKKEETKKKGKQ